MLHIEKIYSSFEREEFLEYFGEKGIDLGEGRFSGDGWEVVVGDEFKRMVGAFPFNAIKLEIWVKEEISDEFLEDLRRGFLRGGG
ncbi:MAG: hypothetical protein ACQEP4_05530 [Bacillota bacterium]